MSKNSQNKNAAVKSAPVNNTATKKKLSVQFITLITVGVILLGIVIAAVAMLVPNIDNDKNFDYVTSDLSSYIYIPEENYKEIKLDLDIAKPHEIDVDVAILYLLNAKKNSVPLYDGVYKTNIEITPGDQVQIYYRGYLIDENGKEVPYETMSNFSAKNATNLVIGSNTFIPGFELGLVGKNPSHYTPFVKITEGTISETDVAYVSFSRLEEGKDEKKDTVSKTALRVDLSDPDLDKTYGTGFRAAILGATVGSEKFSFNATIDGKTHAYSNVTVDFITNCEKENHITVECYFPYDYSTVTLRNETFYFDVYVTGVQVYEAPEFNDEFITELLSDKDSTMKLEDLEDCEGETLVEKYRNHAWDLLNESYETNLKDLIEEEFWNYILSGDVVQIKKYPKNKVEEIYFEYRDDVVYQFNTSGGSIYNEYTGEYESCDNIDDFANIYLGIQYSTNPDWNNTLYKMSENLVKERLVLYYIMRAENIMPTEAELNEKYDEVTQEYLDEYMVQYLESINKTREDYTDAEYEELVEERSVILFNYFDDDYFYETAYYELGLESFRTFVKATTLDERSNLPQKK